MPRLSAMVLLSVIVVSVTGCTLIGMGIGSVVDSGRKSDAAPTSDLTSIESGASVEVRLKSGAHVEGKYRGLAAADVSNPTGLNVLLLDTGVGPARSILLTDVTQLRRAQKRRGKWIGAGLGAALDVVAMWGFAMYGGP